MVLLALPRLRVSHIDNVVLSHFTFAPNFSLRLTVAPKLTPEMESVLNLDIDWYVDWHVCTICFIQNLDFGWRTIIKNRSFSNLARLIIKTMSRQLRYGNKNTNKSNDYVTNESRVKTGSQKAINYVSCVKIDWFVSIRVSFV